MKNNYLSRPELMDSRNLRKVQIDKMLGEMIMTNRSIVIKILNFLENNPQNGYATLGSQLSNILTQEEYNKEIIKLLEGVSLTSQLSVTKEVDKVKERIRGIRIQQIDEIDSSIGELNKRKAKLLRKTGLIQNSADESKVDEMKVQIDNPIESQGNESDSSQFTATPGSDIATLEMDDFVVGDNFMQTSLVLPLHKNIPVLSPATPEFGTIQELKSSGQELLLAVEQNLNRAQEILPDVFNFTELTPNQLQKIVTDMELFAAPEKRKENLIALYDYIENMRRKGYGILDEGTMKKFKRLTEKRVIDDENARFLDSTLEQVFMKILSQIGMHHLIERNIGIESDTLEEFAQKMQKPFISNGIPEDYRKMAPERSSNVGKIICLMRVLDISQLIYTERLKKIVPYYQGTTSGLLKFYSELESKFAKQNKSVKNYLHGDAWTQFEQSITFIRNVDGYMESFGRISSKQEQKLKEMIFIFQQEIQSLIDAYEEFEDVVNAEYNRIIGDEQGAYREILTRLYDRGSNARSTNIGAAGAQRFPKIDNFVENVTGSRRATFISSGRDVVRLCLENPQIMDHKDCPKSFQEIIMLYLG